MDFLYAGVRNASELAKTTIRILQVTVYNDFHGWPCVLVYYYSHQPYKMKKRLPDYKEWQVNTAAQYYLGHVYSMQVDQLTTPSFGRYLAPFHGAAGGNDLSNNHSRLKFKLVHTPQSTESHCHPATLTIDSITFKLKRATIL